MGVHRWEKTRKIPKILADLDQSSECRRCGTGLGLDENSGIDILKQYVGDYDGERIKFLNAQDCDNELKKVSMP